MYAQDNSFVLLFKSHVPIIYWSYAFRLVVYNINRVPFRVLHFHSPYSRLFGYLPYYTFLHVFECLSFPYLRPFNENKMQDSSIICTFFGFAPNHRSYLCLHMESKKVITSWHVIFSEIEFPFTKDCLLYTIRVIPILIHMKLCMFLLG